jgi:hypothetical protein
LLEHWAPPRFKLRLWRAAGILAIAAVVVIVAIATKTDLAHERTRATVVAIPRLVLRAEAEKAAGWEGAPGSDVIPSQTIETETDERRQHWPLATRVRWDMAAPAPAALNKHEVVGVDRHARSRNVASRKHIWRMDAR